MSQKQKDNAPKKTLKQKRKEKRQEEEREKEVQTELLRNARYRQGIVPADYNFIEKRRLDAEAAMNKWKKNRNQYFTELREASRARNAFEINRFFFSNPESVSSPMQFMFDMVAQKKPDLSGLSHLIETCRRSSILDIEGCEFYIKGIVNLACYKYAWINNLDLWKPSSKNRERQFFELANFIFTKYEVPRFLNRCWFDDQAEAIHYREWFINLGQGENIRKQKNLPIELTKKMAHEWAMAPENLTIQQSFRWAQMKAMGANQSQIRGWLSLPIGCDYKSNNDFWLTVIQFFIDNPMLDTNQYRNIYDFIHNQRFVNQPQIMNADGEWVNVGPAQPNFTMKGRTVETLLRQVEQWHNDLNVQNALRYQERNEMYRVQQEKKRAQCWSPRFGNWKKSCGKKDDKAFHYVKELTTGGELFDEGNRMHHCVSSYIDSCVSGSIAIFSLGTSYTDAEENGILTIEVRCSSKEIIQARGKHNGSPTDEAESILNAWAKDKGLKKSEWL